jgi:hypothetical protein
MKNKKGFIKTVIIIVVALVLLKYIYNIDVVGFLTQGRFKELLDQFYGLGVKGWNYFIELIKNFIAKFK